MKIEFTQDYKVKSCEGIEHKAGSTLTCSYATGMHYITRGVAKEAAEVKSNKAIDVSGDKAKDYAAGIKVDDPSEKKDEPSPVSQPAPVSRGRPAKKSAT